MARSIHASTLAEIANNSLRIAHLVSIAFDTPIYLTDHGRQVSYGGNDYSPSGHFLAMSDPSEQRKLNVAKVNLTLSGVSQEYISILLAQNWVNRSAVISKAFLDASGAVIGDPISIFDGLLSNFQIRESDNGCRITLEIASHWADFQRKVGRYTNHNSQQFYFSSDMGMEFSAAATTDIPWGRKGDGTAESAASAISDMVNRIMDNFRK